MKKRKDKVWKRILAFSLACILVVPASVTSIFAGAWDASDSKKFSELRFWENEAPGIRFYINAAARYELETVQEPGYGTNSGDWTVMDLLRGMYTGLDYLNYIPENYFENYYERAVGEVIEREGVLDKSKSTEYSRLMLALSALGKSVYDVGGYDFIDILSQSYKYSYGQGLNGPIWELIALNTGGYELYEPPSSYEEGDINTEGRMLDYIMRSEIRDSENTIGGWVLNLASAGNSADVDITGMALQALAPYYLDEEKYIATGAETPYGEFVQAVERGVYSLYQMQSSNGGFGGWGSNINSESTVQVLVALTALGIDPLAKSIELENIGKSCSFVTTGNVVDGVWSNNMVDALLSFWAKNSGSSEAVGGFKHVVSGNDGGGGAGHDVNGMATDQALYGLIAYDRFLNGENPLYDMTDMTDGSYTEMTPVSYTITFDGNGAGEAKTETYSPYAEVNITAGEPSDEEAFVCWNSEPDGSGTTYWPGEVLSMPEENITLYAMYGDVVFDLTLELNGGKLAEDVTVPDTYTPMDDDWELPTAEEIFREGYDFQGWYTNADFEGKPVKVLEKGSYGDKTFYAKWTLIYDKISEFGSYVSKLEIGNITMSDRTTIQKARALYDSMTEAEKEDGACKLYYSTLVAAEEELHELEESMDAAEVVISLIDNLGDSITLEQQEVIEEARAEYDALTDEEKELITNYEKLVEAEATLEILVLDKETAEAVKEQIKNIGEVTLESETAILEARMAYNDLTESQKAYISDYYVGVLEDAEAALTALQEQAERIANVQELIAQIPEELSLEDDSFQLAAQAKAAYIALPSDEKGMIDQQEVARMEEALNVLYELAQEQMGEEDYAAAMDVSVQIAAFSGEITLEQEEELLAVREAFDGLTVVQQALVENYFSLVKLEMDLEQLKADVELAAQVDELIAQIGEVTLDSADYVASVRTEYQRLTSEQKALVENYQVLVDAENALAVIKYDYQRAEKVTEKILAIGEVTLKSESAILKAEKAYEALTEEQKKYVSAETLQILKDARTEYDRLYSLVLKKITLSEISITLKPGENHSLTVNYDPEDTISDKTVTWSTSNPDIVTVENGVVTAVGNGEAAVLAKVGKLSAICQVHVKTPLEGITLSETSISLAKGQYSYLKVGYLPEDSSEYPEVVWSTSDKKVATVDNGKMSAVGGGDATITATVGTFSESCEVKVYPYAIDYVLNGGTNNSENTPGYTGPWTVTLKDPTRAGYKFDGWYTDAKYKNRITKIQKGSAKDYTLYAKWTKVTAPGRPTIKSLENTANGTMKQTLSKKVTGADGYEVVYSTNSSMSDAVSIHTAYSYKTITGLTTGETYYVKVRAYTEDSTGDKIYGSYSTAKKVTLTIPAKPVISQITTKDNKSLTVSLKEKAEGAYGYQIVVATNTKFTTGKKTVNTTATTKSITGLQAGKTYYIKVRAMSKVNGKNTFGSYTTMRSIKLTAAPGKPTIKSITNTANGSMKVTLTSKISGADGYQIVYSTSSSMSNPVSVYTAYSAKTITGLTTGKTYYVKERAYTKDVNGNKVYGSYSSVKKVALTIPATPVVSKITNSSSKAMTVSLSEKAEGAYGYQIVIATNLKFNEGKKIVNTTALNKTITGLQKGKTYYIKVRAMSKVNGKNTFGSYTKARSLKITK
ncbi:putative uncharacterized protein [Blautia hydrogenotrophica CAG:147]|uniref:InlB B-repeat-containing protein n=1 Tax=Blautia hydrogenotrophica TaxID=53443 RepID=UPI0003374CD4|nr:InlB B-repeat-containing protein [Blautia hydrogenotrophica]CCX58483.1 putative uncharacterized protein [Blautia hydrogenotrophica CAG:147]